MLICIDTSMIVLFNLNSTRLYTCLHDDVSAMQETKLDWD